MTGKLMKYEFKTSNAFMCALWAAVLASSLIFLLAQTITKADILGGSIFAALLDTIPAIVYWLLFALLIIGTVVIILIRFYRSLLSDEGYLMHTLPVRTWELVASKGLVAACLLLISMLVAGLSLFIMAGPEAFIGLKNLIAAVFAGRDGAGYIALIAVECLIIMIASVLKTIYCIYAAMSIGQISNNHKILFSVIAYICINLAILIITIACISLGDATGLDVWLTNHSVTSMSDFGNLQLLMLFLFILTMIQVAIFFVITERMLNRKLNLQ